MKKSRKIIITFVILLVIVFIAISAIKARRTAMNFSAMVRTEQPQRGDLTEFISAPGEIEPKTKVELSAKVSARIKELPYEEGDTVTCGNPDADPPVPASVLVRLDSKDLESQLRSAQAGCAGQEAQLEVEKARIAGQRANLIGLEAQLKQAQRDLERQRELLDSKDISQSTFDQSKLRVDELQSQYDSSKHTIEAAELGLVVLEHNIEAANARIAEAQEALTYTIITSPIDGVVTRVNAEVGEVVVFGTMNNPGTVIIEVADLSKMLVVAEVDEADVAKLQVGQKAAVQVDAYPDKEISGIVDSVALAHTVSNTGTKYYRTEILLDPIEEKLYSGLTAHVDIETRKHADVLKLPIQAILGREVESLPPEIRENCPEVDTEKAFATVVYRYIDGKAIVTPVKIGPSDITHTIIESGVTQEDKIVIGPYKVLEGIGHNQRIQDELEMEAKKQQAGNKADAKEGEE
ncbi:MAG: efflux RND transporter periplasmic adaptor subunit [Sedimentisphaerales bacterium]|nr:efflux RND transporter periplasmic adaptor subunit [Sedimentisphaerales bacterium]